MVTIEMTEPEFRSVYSALEAYRQQMLRVGIGVCLPKQYDNISSVLRQMKEKEE